MILERLTVKAICLTTLQAPLRLCKDTLRVKVLVIKPKARHAADALVASRRCECINARGRRPGYRSLVTSQHRVPWDTLFAGVARKRVA